ncbi:hypothetical protein C7S16_2007 [Burkholderia thailandensis]|uniref:Uncharacterized protein n=1 Tax=Burkholderia thailandensis TaxID=57975 RepID=A0AAW9D2X7_BURTH|nr:hypothetical protein [Burkholderia thailandensis]
MSRRARHRVKDRNGVAASHAVFFARRTARADAKRGRLAVARPMRLETCAKSGCARLDEAGASA